MFVVLVGITLCLLCSSPAQSAPAPAPVASPTVADPLLTALLLGKLLVLNGNTTIINHYQNTTLSYFPQDMFGKTC